jgi:hypothetical protein
MIADAGFTVERREAMALLLARRTSSATAGDPAAGSAVQRLGRS